MGMACKLSRWPWLEAVQDVHIKQLTLAHKPTRPVVWNIRIQALSGDGLAINRRRQRTQSCIEISTHECPCPWWDLGQYCLNLFPCHTLLNSSPL